MRLWHKSLIRVLPKQQLNAQWREIFTIKGSIVKKGFPNHRLVNKVINYPISHLKSYGKMIFAEMQRRGMKPQWGKV